MSLAFEKGIRENMPNSNIIIDKFHVIKYFNDALNNTLKKDIKNGYDLKRTKYLWMSNASNLSDNQYDKFSIISKENSKTARAYQMKLTMQEIYKLDSKQEATIQIKKLINWMSKSKNEYMTKLSKTLRSHLNNILNYFDDRLTNAVLEGINNVVQNIKTNARGFRNIENFKIMIYFYCGDFDISVNSIHPH
jgi:transposase